LRFSLLSPMFRTMSDPQSSAGRRARELIRASATATLSTALGPERWPYGSLVITACDHDGSPILFLSTLAEHTHNLEENPRMSLLFGEQAGAEHPQDSARLSLLGTARRSQEPRLAARFFARHPEARPMAEFRDFAIYQVAMLRARLIGGFADARWVSGETLRLDVGECGPLAEAEDGILEHMNTDHRDAIELYATRLLGREGGGWVMTGCDPEGCDLRREGEVARLPFGTLVKDATEARAELVRLAAEARAAKP
jgi:putative heme iron utilization protein